MKKRLGNTFLFKVTGNFVNVEINLKKWLMTNPIKQNRISYYYANNIKKIGVHDFYVKRKTTIKK
jgi:hypothetical protein